MKKTENGFELCEFENDTCEKCHTHVKEIYFRATDYFDNREGEYWCMSCIQEEIKVNQEYAAQMDNEANLHLTTAQQCQPKGQH